MKCISFFLIQCDTKFLSSKLHPTASPQLFLMFTQIFFLYLKPEFILEELDAAANQPPTPLSNIQTPHTPATPGPMTPGTKGALYGARSKTKPGTSHFGFKSSKNKNKNTNNQQNTNNKQVQSKEPATAKTWAEVATFNIPNEMMEIKDPREYVE